jgi:hypothetical protein
VTDACASEQPEYGIDAPSVRSGSHRWSTSSTGGCTRRAPELGRERVYQLAPSADHLLHVETGVSRDLRGKVLGNGGFDFETLAAKHAAGWRFVIKPAGSDAGDVPDLLVIRSGGRRDFPSPDHEMAQAADGDRLLLLGPPKGTRRSAGRKPVMASTA